jgi:hypothetical protein
LCSPKSCTTASQSPLSQSGRAGRRSQSVHTSPTYPLEIIPRALVFSSDPLFRVSIKPNEQTNERYLPSSLARHRRGDALGHGPAWPLSASGQRMRVLHAHPVPDAQPNARSRRVVGCAGPSPAVTVVCPAGQPDSPLRSRMRMRCDSYYVTMLAQRAGDAVGLGPATYYDAVGLGPASRWRRCQTRPGAVIAMQSQSRPGAVGMLSRRPRPGPASWRSCRPRPGIAMAHWRCPALFHWLFPYENYIRGYKRK